jgi:integrase
MTDDDEYAEFLAFKAFKRSRAASPVVDDKGPPLPTIRQLFELYRPTAESKRSWPSVGKCHWMHLLPFFGDKTVEECSLETGDEYQRFRLTQRRLVPDGHGGMKPGLRNVQPATINNEMNSMRALLNWCLRNRKIDHNPFTAHPDLPVEQRRQFHCNETDFLKILEHCPPVARLMFILAYETGMRRDEFRLLEWTEVNLQSDPATITLPKVRVKGRKKGRTIALSQLAVDCIKAAPRITPSRYVFTNPRLTDGSPYNKGTLYTQFVNARTRAKVHGPGDQAYWIHSLRKSYGTNKAIAGMPVYALMAQMGHSSFDVHREYTELSPDHLKALTPFLEAGTPRMGPRPIERVIQDREESDAALREFVGKIRK